MPVSPPFARLAFAEPIGRTDDLQAAARTLAGDLAAGLENAGHGARRVVLTLCEPAGEVHCLAAGTSRASRDPDHLAGLFDERLAEIAAEFGIEAMTLAATVTERIDGMQADLAGAGAARPAGAATLIDRLSNRLGNARVVRFAARESHLPERAVRIRPALDGHPPAEAAWPKGPRPLRLLPRPEAVEATAPVPDDPPVMFRWRRVVHRIVRADGPERVGPEWWRAPEDADGTHLRDYYRVEDTAGRRFWLYREGLYRADARPAWFVHGIFE
jgi:protein ImuB